MEPLKRRNTIPPGKERINFDDDEAIVRRIDEIASNEGLSRADICRRAMRFFLASGSTNRIIPSVDQAA